MRATKDYANTRYSTLDQINVGNVASLRVAWTFDTGVPRGQEAAPIVANNTMYVVAPWPNTLFALDLMKPGGPLKWKSDPNPSPAAKGEACCDWVNRGAAFDGGKIFYNTLDGYTVAVDANTGKLVWRTHLGDISKGETITMAPTVVHGKLLVGDSGGEFGVRGWLAALDAGTGKVVWQAYNTGPDKDVLIGDKFKPFYASDKGTDLGVKTWPPDAWRVGGGTVWGFVAYDASSNLIYYGSANPGPWNADARPGDNKWTSGLWARDADTGQAVWFYQMSPHDLFDWDGINEDILLDLPWKGATRKVLVRPDRNGYMYLWIWHIPALYQATLTSDWIHAAQHLSLLLTAILFWSALYGVGRSAMSYGAATFYVFGTAVQCSALGALLTFSTVLWYPVYRATTARWGITPLQDQQLGGVIMWVPSGVVLSSLASYSLQSGFVNRTGVCPTQLFRLSC